jgi:uncharacterized protein
MNWAELELADWRRQVHALYTSVREEADPVRGHEMWRAGRDRLFLHHPQSPLPPDHAFRRTGLLYWPYDPELRFELSLLRLAELTPHLVESDNDETTVLQAIGRIELPPPVDGVLTLWWARQYGGGLFLPVRDQTSGTTAFGGTTYGGGRYLLDTVKGVDLGGTSNTLVIDLNFLYHPSCCYSDNWKCPLAPAENTLAVPLCAGERIV